MRGHSQCPLAFTVSILVVARCQISLWGIGNIVKFIQQALTFDDVLLIPRYSDVVPREVDISTKLSRRMHITLPFLSAAMDTVTESRLAIYALALSGLASLQDRDAAIAAGFDDHLPKPVNAGILLEKLAPGRRR